MGVGSIFQVEMVFTKSIHKWAVIPSPLELGSGSQRDPLLLLLPCGM